MGIGRVDQMPLAVAVIFCCGCGDKTSCMAARYGDLPIDVDDGMSETGDIQIGKPLWLDLDCGTVARNVSPKLEILGHDGQQDR